MNSTPQVPLTTADIEKIIFKYLETEKQNQGATTGGSSPSQSASGSSQPSIEPKVMDVRVDLWLQDFEEVKRGGHEFLSVQTDWNLNKLCHSLKTQFCRIQDLPRDQRPNLEFDTFWSEDHRVTKIKAVSKNNAWDTDGDSSRDSLICEENCQRILRAMQQGKAPEALAVYISRPHKDYLQ